MDFRNLEPAQNQASFARRAPSVPPRTAWFNFREAPESRPRKSAQGDKWSFCLTAGKIGPRIRRDDEQTSTPEPYTGFQGEGGACRGQGRSNTGSIGGAVRRASQSDHVVESPA